MEQSLEGTARLGAVCPTLLTEKRVYTAACGCGGQPPHHQTRNKLHAPVQRMDSMYSNVAANREHLNRPQDPVKSYSIRLSPDLISYALCLSCPGSMALVGSCLVLPCSPSYPSTTWGAPLTTTALIAPLSYPVTTTPKPASIRVLLAHTSPAALHAALRTLNAHPYPRLNPTIPPAPPSVSAPKY